MVLIRYRYLFGSIKNPITSLTLFIFIYIVGAIQIGVPVPKLRNPKYIHNQLKCDMIAS